MPLEMPRRKFIAAAMAAAASPAAPLFGAAATDLATLTLKQASDLVRRRDASPVDLAQACFNRIDKYDKSINAFITVTRDQALATAREMEAELKSGKWRGPLHGIPIALKDNIDTAGIRTTAASGVFKDRIPTAPDIFVPGRICLLKLEVLLVATNRQLGCMLILGVWRNHTDGRTISKAVSESSPKVRMTSMSRRIAVSTSSVVQLPNRIQIAFGGAPLSVAKKPKSLSLDTTTNPSCRQYCQIERSSFWARPANSVWLLSGNRSASRLTSEGERFWSNRSFITVRA